MAAAIIRRNDYIPRQYTVIDLNAGPGRYLLGDDDKAVDGTPLLSIRRLVLSGMLWRAAFIEQNPDMALQLQFWLGREAEQLSVTQSKHCVLNGANATVVLPWVQRNVPARQAVGLIIHDPNGAPRLDLLEQLTEQPQLKRFDVAVYVQATSLKRVLNLPANQYDIAGWRPLDEALRRVKPKWVVRTPMGSNQYALCIGSNGALGAAWAKQGFWPSDSERGRLILERLTFTRAERRSRDQPRLL